MTKQSFWSGILFVMMLMLAFPACSQAAPQSSQNSSTLNTQTDSSKPLVALALLHHKKSSQNPTEEKNAVHFTIETVKGTMQGFLYTKEAPITTQNFIDLVNAGFYNGLTFHRVEPGFVIQTGDPTATGSGGSDKTIPLEIAPGLSHDAAGVLAMARTNDPNSASSQFYITLAPAKFLDKNYAVFGRLTDGVDVAEKIKVGDKITKLSLDNQPAASSEKSAPEAVPASAQ